MVSENRTLIIITHEISPPSPLQPSTYKRIISTLSNFRSLQASFKLNLSIFHSWKWQNFGRFESEADFYWWVRDDQHNNLPGCLLWTMCFTDFTTLAWTSVIFSPTRAIKVSDETSQWLWSKKTLALLSSEWWPCWSQQFSEVREERRERREDSDGSH